MGKRSKKQNSPQKSSRASQVDQGKQSEETTAPIQRRQDGTRETIESIVVAFILAFLFRTFEAEAFVIPTGSMAPTLLGRHKDIECEQCKFHFTVGASDEVDSNDQRFRPAQRLKTAFCPNCRYETDVSELLAFKGDRILVTKFQFEIDDPERWQVSVFKYPEDPQTNYIKRVVGLPGETLKIERGDVLARTDDVAGIWQNLRKDDPNKQRALQISVYDNDHPERALHQLGWPERWAPVRRDGSFEGIAGWVEEQDGWLPDTEARSFRLSDPQASNEDYHWIRYRHIVPAQTDWRQMRAVSGDLEIPAHAIEFNAQPQLITDFCGYNAFTGGHGNRYDPGLFWVGDLTLTCRVDISEVKENAELLLELNEGIRRYRCRIVVNNGQATLVLIDDGLNADEEQLIGTAETSMTGTGEFDIMFANVDNRLCLWIDDKLVEFDTDGVYRPSSSPAPRDEDLIPVGVAAKGMDVTVSKLLIERDIYYRAEKADDNDFGERPPDRHEYEGGAIGRGTLSSLVYTPQQWYDEYRTHSEPAEFPQLGPDEYFVMGDNSPRSKDSRLWPNTRQAKHRHAVPRSALVGKAFFIYWPHAIPFGDDGKGYGIDVPPFDRLFYHRGPNGHALEPPYQKFAVPFYPNVGRMHRIR